MSKIKKVFSLGMILGLVLLCPQIKAETYNVNDWTSLGGNNTNNKVSYVKTPASNDDFGQAILLPNSQTTATGFNLPSDPVVYQNKIYFVVKGTIYVDDLNGQQLKSAPLGNDVKNSPISMGYLTKLTVGDNKLFVSVQTGGKAIITAYDLNSLKLLWQTPAITGQLNSSLHYYNGYLYTGVAINSNSSANPCDGYYLALATADNKAVAGIQPLIWTYPTTLNSSDIAGHGYYFTDPVITNDAIFFAGDDGTIISHSLDKNIVYDSYEIKGNSDNLANKVRSTLVYYDNYLFVATQNSHSLLKIKINNQFFERDDSILTAQNLQTSGGIAVTDDYIYTMAGGASIAAAGNGGLSIFKTSDLSLVYQDQQNNSQSIPAVVVNGNTTLIYFIDYSDDKLVLVTDKNASKVPSVASYSLNFLKGQYNMGNVLPLGNGNLLLTVQAGGNNDGFYLLPNKNSALTNQNVTDLTATINGLSTYQNLETFYQIKTQLGNDYDVSNIENKLLTSFDQETQKVSSKLDNTDIIAIQTNLMQASNLLSYQDLLLTYQKDNSTIQNDLEVLQQAYNHLKTLSDNFWTGKLINTEYDQIINNLADSVFNSSNSQTAAVSNQGYIVYLVQNYQSQDSGVQAKLKQLNAEINKEKYQELDANIKQLNSSILYPKANYTLTLVFENNVTKLYNQTLQAGNAYQTAYPDSYQKIVADYNSMVALRKAVNQLKVDIQNQIFNDDPIDGAFSMTTTKQNLINSIITRYNNLSSYDKAQANTSGWYTTIVDYKNALTKINASLSNDVTYYFKLNGSTWILTKTTKSTSTLNQTTYYSYNKAKSSVKGLYHYVSQSQQVSQTKRNNVITKIVTTKHNLASQNTLNQTQVRNAKGKYIVTYYLNTSYYSNKKKKTILTKKRDANTNVQYYYSKVNYYSNGKYSNTLYQNYYSNAKKKDYKYTTYYANGKKKTYVYYTYNSKGKLIKSYKYKYNSVGKRIG